jgi:hypothetical protein
LIRIIGRNSPLPITILHARAKPACCHRSYSSSFRELEPEPKNSASG